MPAPATERHLPALTEDYTAWLITSLALRLSRGAAAYYTREWGLASAEYRILMALGSQADCKATQLAAAADVDKAAVSRSLQVLAGRGLVAVLKSGREVVVSLTPEGAALQGQLRAASRRRDRRLTRGLSASELSRLKDDLLRLVDNVAYMNQP